MSIRTCAIFGGEILLRNLWEERTFAMCGLSNYIAFSVEIYTLRVTAVCNRHNMEGRGWRTRLVVGSFLLQDVSSSKKNIESVIFT